MGLWLFIFDADGAIRHVPQRIAHTLHLGEPPLPEYAGTRVRYALAFVTTANRRRIAIARIDSGYFSFDATGTSQWELASGGIAALETYEAVEKEKAQTGQIVSIKARLARKKWEHEHRWTPTHMEVEQMCSVIWPKKRQT